MENPLPKRTNTFRKEKLKGTPNLDPTKKNITT
jgi:hypothetical protein